MLTIARLRMLNWKCYRGETILDLEPKAYAVFAREVGDPDRSNFLGKSSLCEAVDFALYGRLADEFRAKKRGWISRGEKRGEVELTLSDGSRIVRSQSLTGSERLWCFPPGKPDEGATQDEAQKRIEELIGLSRADFAATRYFRQGEMARLITLDPGPRLDLVAGWLRLGPLQDCEDEAAGVLREVARRRDQASAEARAAEDAETGAYRRAGVQEDPDAALRLDSLIAAAQAAQVPAQAMVDAAQAALARDGEREQARALAETYERTIASGVSLRSEVAALAGVAQETPPGPRWDLAVADARARMVEELREADEALAAAGGARGRAEAEERSKRTIASGRFDGGCPLVGAPCPARAFVEARGAEMRGAAAAASTALQRAGKAYDEAAAAQGRAATRLSLLDAKSRRLGELRAEAGRLRPAHERWQALSEASAGAGEARAALERGRAELRAAQEREAALRGCQEAARAARERAGEASEEARRLEVAVRTAAAAVAVFGRGGAQRRMAEDALAEIEARACEMMAAAGVPLSVEVRWSREGSGVAATCSSCGEPFPRSEKVKACARCGDARGPNLVHKLDIEPSAQSGGARDLCGIFVQLAAAAWLVEDRGARWATAMLDEPLAALDKAMRSAVSSHLTAILRETNVYQAIIVGHDRAALDALPGRIVVESAGGWSTARVEA